jgi:hypothetical protein
MLVSPWFGSSHPFVHLAKPISHLRAASTYRTPCRYRGCTTTHAAEFECSLPWLFLSRPPIMAGITPSPEVSPVSAATTNGQFPRDSFCLNLSTLPDAGNFVLKSALRSPHLLESPNGVFSGNSGLNNPFKKRPRNMSQSSGTDREMSSDLTPPAQSNGTAPTSNGTNGNHTEPRPVTKKRPSTDTIDYPRRRATIAVLPYLRYTSYK